MTKFWRRWFAVIALAASVAPPLQIASAQQAGWSVSYDPRKRVFLSFRNERDGPRTLLLACLRDADLFTVASEGVARASDIGRKMTLTLANGGARYAVAGEISQDPIAGATSFSIDFDLDAPAVRKLKSELLPMLDGKGVIKLMLDGIARELPVGGLPDALKRFKSVCLGNP
jgi:hypothetical protein